MLKKILIANRGEIACRIIRTAKKMGIKTVAVFSEIDAGALHVKEADEAIKIGPAIAKESYLNAEAIINAAMETKADSIHPGYGFLSENPEFAELTEHAGLIFIGPKANAIRLMGSKLEAKAIVSRVGIPVIPGYHGQDQTETTLKNEAQRLGIPLIIKSSAGGGGKGMRVVTDFATFSEKLAACQRESENYFNDNTVILERYLGHPRHIEVQIFADHFGNIVHLFERDCSIQRRHQKIIEEAPAFGIPEDLRQKIGNSAKKIAQTINYLNAGTVEFLLDEDQNFYFMEMNTRLQVEHPVTEMITGLDLVEWQIRVASGEALPMQQEDLQHQGHAIEARIYAEDPNHDFLPSTGTIVALKTPLSSSPLQLASPSLRLDTGIALHDKVTIYYDPLLAKLISHGDNRLQAIARLQEALENFHLLGVGNNLSFLRTLLHDEEFQLGTHDTGFLTRKYDSKLSTITEESADFKIVLIAAALAECLQATKKNKQKILKDTEPNSPWHQINHWRLNLDAWGKVNLRFDTGSNSSTNIYTIEFIQDAENEFQIRFPDHQFPDHQSNDIIRAYGHLENEQLQVRIDDQQYNFLFLSGEELRYLYWDGRAYQYTIESNLKLGSKEVHSVGQLTAPMPGTLTHVLVKEGSSIQVGEPLMILEAMKMEHAILAPFSGKIVSIPFHAGDIVDAGAELAVVEPTP